MDFDVTAPGGSGPIQSSDGAQAQLICVHGGGPTVALDRSELRIGRLSDNDVVLPSDRVSRHHALVCQDRAGYAIEDLGSFNGTRLNGRLLEPNRRDRLRHKDVIQLSDYRFLFVDWSGLAGRLGLETIRLDSEQVRREADELVQDFLHGGEG